jgi:Protein of unknown function (DUF2917)
MSSVLHYLSPSKCQTLQAAPHTHLHVVSGRLWVTMANDTTDYFVEAGQALVLKAGQVTLQTDSPQPATFAVEAYEKCEARRYAGFCAPWLPTA